MDLKIQVECCLSPHWRLFGSGVRMVLSAFLSREAAMGLKFVEVARAQSLDDPMDWSITAWRCGCCGAVLFASDSKMAQAAGKAT